MFQVAQSELDSLFLYLNLFFSHSEIVQLLHKSLRKIYLQTEIHIATLRI